MSEMGEVRWLSPPGFCPPGECNMHIPDDEFYDDGLHEMTPEESERYAKQVKESQGFDVEEIPNVFALGIIQPVPLECGYDGNRYTQLAIDYHNKEEGGNLKLVEIIKLNCQAAAPVNYYITLKAQDVGTGDTDIYQALVISRIPDEKSYVRIFRKRPMKEGAQELN